MRRDGLRTLAVLLLLVAAASWAMAQQPQQPQLLRYKFTTGDKYEWLITSQQQGTVTQGGQTMQPTVTGTVRLVGEVKGVTAEGWGQVCFRFTQVSNKMSVAGMAGMESALDADAGTTSQTMAGQAPQNAQIPEQYVGPLRAGFTVTINDRGIPCGMQGIQEYMNALMPSGLAAAANPAILDTLFIPFPEEPVTVNQVWSPPAPAAAPGPAPAAPAGASPFGAPAPAPAPPVPAPAAAPPMQFRYDGIETVGGLPYHKISVAMQMAMPDGVIPMGQGMQTENKGVVMTTTGTHYRSVDTGIFAYGKATNKQTGTVRNTSTMQGPNGQQMQMDMSMTDMTTEVEARREK